MVILCYFQRLSGGFLGYQGDMTHLGSVLIFGAFELEAVESECDFQANGMVWMETVWKNSTLLV